MSDQEIERLRQENATLRSGRLDLVRDLNRVIALGDFALRCASAEEPGDVLDRALLVLGQVLSLDSKAAFGLDGSGIDMRVSGPMISCTSPPEQKFPSAPCIITALTSWLSARERNRSRSSAYDANVSGFLRSGRLSVITPTPSSMRHRKCVLRYPASDVGACMDIVITPATAIARFP